MLQHPFHPSLLLAMILALSLAGAWMSGQMVKLHDGVWTATTESKVGIFGRLCRATAKAGLDCTAARHGAWSQIRIPILRPHRDFTVSLQSYTIPLAFLGLAYFTALGVWFAFIGGPRPIGGGWHKIVLMIACGGGAVSLFYLALMASGRTPWCVGCIAVHTINLLLLLAIWRLGAAIALAVVTEAVTASQPQSSAHATLTAREATSAIAFALMLIAGMFAYRRAHLIMRDQLNRLAPYKAQVEALRADPRFVMRHYLAEPRQPIPIRGGETGSARRARLTVFTDYECPACYCNALAVENQAVAAFKGSLTVEIRHYPLCNACNEEVEDALHPNACDAAWAAEAARLQGGDEAFQRMHELLFKHRTRLGEETFRDLATEIGLDPDLLLEQMKLARVRKVVQADIDLARRLGVNGTPAMFLDGRRVPELCEGPVFWQAAAVASARSRARGAPRSIETVHHGNHRADHHANDHANTVPPTAEAVSNIR